MEPQIRDIIVDVLEEKLLPAIAQIERPVDWLTNDEACQYLKCQASTLRRAMRDGVFVAGYHYSGSGRDRRWNSKHLSRYLEVRDIPGQQERDIARWQRSLSK